MSFRDEFLWSKKTYAEWSLENTTRDGFEGNQERLNALQKQVKSTFEQGIDRIAQSQAESSAALQGELAYQAERISEQIAQNSRDVVSAVERGSDNIVHSIQQMSDYLGSELCEVRWAVERQTKVSERMLEVMLNSLSNESRQYFEQGVKCYETTEYDFARERFSKALEANRTNHFAYQYLGFVAVAEDNSNEAIRNFDLARKFAETGYYKALALSHLARSNHALGDDNTAVSFAQSATAAHSDTAKFWYELASYNSFLGRKDDAISALREAIERDLTYWAVVSSDTDFDSIRFDVNRLLDELREREKQIARRAFDNLKSAIDTAKKVGAENEISVFSQKVSEYEGQFRKNNVFVYREIIPGIKELHKKVFDTTIKALESQIKDNQLVLHQHQNDKSKTLEKFRSSLSKLEAKQVSIPFGMWYGNHIVVFGIIGFLTFCVVVVHDNKSIANFGACLYAIIAPFVIIGTLNGLIHLFDVVLPKLQISNEIGKKRSEFTIRKNNIENEYQNTLEPINNQITELETAKAAIQSEFAQTNML